MSWIYFIGCWSNCFEAPFKLFTKNGTDFVAAALAQLFDIREKDRYRNIVGEKFASVAD